MDPIIIKPPIIIKHVHHATMKPVMKPVIKPVMKPAKPVGIWTNSGHPSSTAPWRPFIPK